VVGIYEIKHVIPEDIPVNTEGVNKSVNVE
jgi:hypothetical protein